MKNIIQSIEAIMLISVTAVLGLAAAIPISQAAEVQAAADVHSTMHKIIRVDGLDIFYREAGPVDAPVLLLLHGSLIIQNGNAYDEGLREFWDPFKAYWKDGSEKNAEALRKLLTLEATRWQYTHGTRQVESISPDNWLVDQTLLDRPGNKEIQLALFGSYASNPPLYPKWHEYFRQHQPPTLIVWGKNDIIFPADGAEPYRRDLKNLEFHLIDTGHFALEEEGAQISALIRAFLAKQTL